MNEDEIRASLATIENYKEQVVAIEGQLEFVNATLEEHHRARVTLDGISKLKKGQKTLVPIGANTYIHAVIDEPDHAIIGVGMEVSVEKTMEDTTEALLSRISDLDAAKKGMEDHMAVIIEKANTLSTTLQSEYERIQLENAQQTN